MVKCLGSIRATSVAFPSKNALAPREDWGIPWQANWRCRRTCCGPTTRHEAFSSMFLQTWSSALVSRSVSFSFHLRCPALFTAREFHNSCFVSFPKSQEVTGDMITTWLFQRYWERILLRISQFDAFGQGIPISLNRACVHVVYANVDHPGGLRRRLRVCGRVLSQKRRRRTNRPDVTPLWKWAEPMM